ncbi:MAG: DNA polymerase III subunit delta [Clostridiales Family XIII bacterium]|nr:DNA polymerase III subunit delta [Clostridiales Family XIII bacterium]
MAFQKPQAGFRQIEQDLRDGFTEKVSVVLLHGEEPLMTDIYANRMAESCLFVGAETMDAVVFDADEMQAYDVIAASDTLPMLSSKRVIRVRNLKGGERSTLGGAEMKRLEKYLTDVPQSTLLIFMASDKIPKNATLCKTIEKVGRVYEFGRLDKADLRAFVRSRFKSLGKTAEQDVIDAILAATGYLQRDANQDLYSVEGDVIRIAAYSAAPEIQISDVSACMGVSIDTDVFRMLDAVSVGDKGLAAELLFHLTERGENTFRLLSLLISQFELMLNYKDLHERGSSFPDILKALDIKSEFRLKKAASYADRYSLEEIMTFLERLYRVEPDIRSGLYNERLALTMFIAEM